MLTDHNYRAQISVYAECILYVINDAKYISATLLLTK